MLQVWLAANVADTSPGGMKALEDEMNTFLKQHGNDEIDFIQVCCTDSGGFGPSKFKALGMIAYIPTSPHSGKKPRKKASKKG